MSLPLCRGYYAQAPGTQQGLHPRIRDAIAFPRVLAVLLATLPVVAAGALALGFAGALQFLAPEIPAAAQLREVRVQLPMQVRSPRRQADRAVR